ncbi:hypothetical protein BJ165DRAFT_878254 [Panaeolus papilionaceus]|nr:hypothetical protein BJ165DRAFT_878254 [Panaeolus papilionaceus]
MAMNLTQIDNADARVVYGGGWSTYKNGDMFNNTIALTRSVGSTATLMFTGNSIAVYGELGPYSPDIPAITKYEIDDGDPITFAPPSPASDLPRLLFFQSRAYPYGTHKLVMTNMMDSDWIWLDYFEVTNNGDPSVTSLPLNPTFTPNISPTSTSPAASNSNKPSSGVIVGATLGGLAAALLIMAAILFCWWRRKLARSRQTFGHDSESSYSPFRRSMLMRNVEQSCHHCDGHMVQREGMMTMPTHSHGVLPSSAAQPPLDYPAFLVVPPAKMRNQVSVETGPDGAHLPAYST